MKNILTLYILFFVTSIFGQQLIKKVALHWEDHTKIANSYTDTVLELPLVTADAFDENFLPFYYEQWGVGNNSKIENYEIKNIVYASIDSNLFPKETQDFFPKTIKSNFSIKNARDVAFAQFKIIPLVIKDAQLKRIISFEIVYNLQPKVALRSTSTMHDSPLSSGEWYRFAIKNTGVYKITKSFLSSIGVNVNNINPKNIQIYGNGGTRLPEANDIFRYDGLQENAIFVSGEEDDNFDNNDYILLYAQGPDTWIPKVALNKADHQKNIYSDKAYYFVHIGVNGKRIQQQTPISGTINQTITTFNDYAVHELEKINLDHFGQQFFGENFTINETQKFSLPFADIDVTKDVQVKFSVATIASESSRFRLNYNNNNLIDLLNGTFGYTTIGSIASRTATFTPVNENLEFEVVFDNNGYPSSKGFLDYIEINGIKKLIARDKQFSFRNYTMANSPITDIGEFVIENSTNIHQIWEVTNKIQPALITNTSDTSDFTFLIRGGELQEYILLNASNYYTPIKLNSSNVNNQNLHAIRDIDYLIVTKEVLLEEANRLSDYHKSKGLSTLVLTEQLIYNEFSSGAKDPVAIRDFIKHLYFNASSNDKRVKYVLMFGDTSFDFQNIEGNNKDTNVIAYQSFNSTSLAFSYVTDDFFVMLDANEGDFTSNNGTGDLIDVAIGRMPVKNRKEAEVSVNKTLHYYSEEAFGKWRNHIALIADDVDKGASDFPLETKVEAIADLIKQHTPTFNISKIYADAYIQEISSGGEAYPEVKKAIDKVVEEGSLIINYFGHGGENGWGAERFLDVPQIKAWENLATSPLFITITCEFSRYDNPTRIAAGENVFSNEKGGSVNMITTSREVLISFGGSFNIDLMRDVLEFDNMEERTIAQSLAKSKNRHSGQKQRFFITFFGDPAMHLSKPKANIRITHMNDVAVTVAFDSIKALSHVYFKGIVTDSNNDILPNFNGELSVIVYDKSVDKITLNNDNQTYLNSPTIMEFDLRDSKIFNGRATVENGNWQFDFIAPRDIRIAEGTAKLSFYADNKIIDKNGYNTDIIIGGINYDAPEDNTGPKIKLFMNDASFIDGGNTNQSPLFLAVLEDESGINTSFTSVDHDIVVILDGDQGNPIIMNDYYETELNDFKKGKVTFPFKNLSVGLHTLTFKCWDTYNNPSESSISFVVVSDSELTLDNVLNYPNPFINYTEFWFNHNKPNESLEVQIQIFTISGKIIKTINQTILNASTLSRTITWNGLDDFGNKIGKGVYIYKLKVKVISSGLKSEKIEKLVILQ